MVTRKKGTNDDIADKVRIADFDGGLVTNIGALQLAQNQTPDSLNCLPFQGRLQYAGGFKLYCPLLYVADDSWQFYDYTENNHFIVWAGGNMYDCQTGAPVLLVASCYTVGQQVGHQDMNGILYWSTITVPIQSADIPAATYGPIIQSGNPAQVASVPMTNFLTAFNGSLIALSFYIGSNYFPTQFIASGVNDVTSWYAAFIQQSGNYDGGTLVSAQVMGIANQGVQPTKSFIVFKSTGNIFIYTGAIGALVEEAIASPVGIKDSTATTYCPSPDSFGIIIYVGADNQIYQTNGVEAATISDNVLPTLPPIIASQSEIIPNARFNVVYNEQFQYWYVSCGSDIGYLYKLEEKAWMACQGWPSGTLFKSVDPTGVPAVYAASTDPLLLGVWQIMDPMSDFNGKFPVVYYKTPWIHGGDEEQRKQFLSVEFTHASPASQFQVDCISAPNNLQQQLSALSLVFPPTGGQGAVWDVAVYDVSQWISDFLPSFPQTLHGLISCPVNPSNTRWADADAKQQMYAGAMQIKVSLTGGVPAFDLLSVATRFIKEGFEIIGSAPDQATNGGGTILPQWAPDSILANNATPV